MPTQKTHDFNPIALEMENVKDDDHEEKQNYTNTCSWFKIRDRNISTASKNQIQNSPLHKHACLFSIIFFWRGFRTELNNKMKMKRETICE